MAIQASGARSLAILAAALVLSVVGSAPTFATDWGTIPAPTMTSDSAATVTSPTAEGAPAATQTEMQAAPASPSADQATTTADSAAASTEDTASNTVAVSNDDSSGWDKASVIGKIFIACGTLLTLGSAARMFML